MFGLDPLAAMRTNLALENFLQELESERSESRDDRSSSLCAGEGMMGLSQEEEVNEGRSPTSQALNPNP